MFWLVLPAVFNVVYIYSRMSFNNWQRDCHRKLAFQLSWVYLHLLKYRLMYTVPFLQIKKLRLKNFLKSQWRKKLQLMQPLLHRCQRSGLEVEVFVDVVVLASWSGSRVSSGFLDYLLNHFEKRILQVKSLCWFCRAIEGVSVLQLNFSV